MILYRFIILTFISSIFTQIPGGFSITRIHYGGGGDWYADPSSIPNLLNYVEKTTNMTVNKMEQRAKIGEDLFHRSPYLYMTGHGNVKFTDDDAFTLRDHLLAGAFLHADDNYGMDKSFRREMEKVFPDKEWVELPPSHDIFKIHFSLPTGLPKVHEHDKKRPQALGLFDDGRLIVLYTFESDLGDGWEDEGVHHDDHQIRTNALKMGTNIIVYVLSQ
jgi:hypothetical protein|tara:strand:+ start:1562 stop:2215 length:654 start_codon:yes stop_codon:yes gene_type:complete